MRIRSRFQGACLIAALILFGVAIRADQRGASARVQKSFPFAAGGTVWVVAAFQDVFVTAKSGSSVNVDIFMEATAFDAKWQLEQFTPTFVQWGPNVYIFANNVKDRLEPSHLEDKQLPTFKAQAAMPAAGFSGRISVEVPPGMSLSVITYTGRCFLKGDLGGAKARFQTNTGRISVKGAADAIETQTGYERVELELTRKTSIRGNQPTERQSRVSRGNAEPCGAFFQR